jgi:5-methylcytosine-specific restriction endonuclease McrA
MSILSDPTIYIRPSFKKFCEQDTCRAALFDYILRVIADKSVSQSPDDIQSGKIVWNATAAEITENLDHSWSLNKIRQELAILVSQGYIGRSENSQNKMDHTTHLRFALKEAQKFKSSCAYHGVCLTHHTNLPDEVINLLQCLDAINTCCCSEVSQSAINPKQIELIPEKENARLKTHLLDAMRSGLPATLTLQEWLNTLKHFNYRCAYCSNGYAVLEHFIPVSLGGGTTANNVVPACYSCNSRKSTYHPYLIPNTQNFNLEAVKRVDDYLKGRVDD